MKKIANLLKLEPVKNMRHHIWKTSTCFFLCIPIIKTVVTYMDLSARCAVAKCLVCWLFPDKLALSNLTGLGAVVIPTDCLTDCGFRSRTSWTHWLGKKPFFPRRRPSNIPLLSSPLVTGMEKNGELVNWLIWRPFYFCLIDF